MERTRHFWLSLIGLAALSVPHTALAAEPDAATIIKRAIDYWRDVSSYSVVDMTIRRPDWTRTMTIRVWTRGQKESLVRV
ncbi:MAG: outer membrane lipoprotein-sorting protein, partial [Pseudomonadota bacterium]